MNSWREEDVLTGFMFVCVICHGMFFVREWLVLGISFILFRLLRGLQGIKNINIKKINLKQFLGHISQLCKTNSMSLVPVGLFSMMIILSLIGLFHPVRSAEGWLEAFRWLIFLATYLWGRQLAANTEKKEIILHRILLVALLTTFLAWMPGSEMIWARPSGAEEGRFVATFGYANAAAVFFGCQLLLLLRERKLKFLYLSVFVIGIITTGSRTAVVLFVIFSVLLLGKRFLLKRQEDQKESQGSVLGFYQGAVWEEHKQETLTTKTAYIGKILGLIFLFFLFQQAAGYGESALRHLLDWTDTSLAERLMYYKDSLRLAANGYFLPQAGGWLGFPFVQTVSYWTLHPHSSFCQIMLNQGLAGIVILGLWVVKGIKGYLKEVIRGTDLTIISSKTAILYLGIHSLVDVDLSFGVLGILFWLLVGLNSR